jgi:polyvinyl alcohol dehydrogenase (cytochrome)
VKIYTCMTLFPLFAAVGLTAGCGSRGQSEPEGQTSSAQGAGSAQLDCGGAGGWKMFGQNVCNTRSVSDSGPLSPRTASKLAVKWTFQAAGDISATPAIDGNDLYVPDWGGMLNKIDTRTGKVDWSVSVGAVIAGSDAGAGANDAPAPIVSRDTPIVTQDSVIFGVNRGGSIGGFGSLAIVAALDRQTGALKWQTQVDAHPTAHITSSPVLHGTTVYVGVASDEEFYAALPAIANVPYPCCSFRGSVVALNAATGQVLWKTYTIEDGTYFLSDGKTPSGFAGAAVWSSPTIDRGRGSLYVTTGNNYSEPSGEGTLPAGDHIESVLSLDLKTGAIKWAQRMSPGAGDVWNLLTFLVNGPSSGGPDWDFGSSAILFSTSINGVTRNVLGAGQKSGVYWALDPDTGNVLWNTPVGPGGHLGGIHWGSAVDEKNVYVPVNDETGVAYTLGGSGAESGQQTSVGSWAALDPSTGSIKWQVANPTMTAPLAGTSVNGPVSAANGVLFGGSMDAKGTMFAFDGKTGAVLWSFQSGATVYGGPAIANGTVYWGNGYPAGRLKFGTPGGTLYAFQVTQ